MNNIYFIDSNTPDIQTLIAGLPADANVVILQADKNGLEQIAAYLQANDVKNFDAIHLFSHGDASELYLGNSTVTADTLNQNADLLANIGQSLSTTGDILLYGCNVAQGEIGQNFVNTFANLTGADIAASDDLTGAADLGGDWDLEVQNGVIDATAIENLQYDSILKMNGTIASITPDTGTATDFITSATTLTFAGVSSGPGETVYLYDGSTSVGSQVLAMGPSTAWSISASNLTEGSHTFTLKNSTLATTFATKTVVIDTTAPTLTSLVISNPITETTDADTLVYRATFDAAVSNVDATDFNVTGTTATVTGVSLVSAGVYDVTVSSGDLENLNGLVSLGFLDSQNITDVAGNVLVKPTATASYTLINTGNIRPTLSAFELITGTTANTEQTITFDNLKTVGDEADSDGTVTAFVIAAVSSGTLKIGASSEAATAWEANVNDVVDGTHNIYWTPSTNANGTLNAFTAVAKDDGSLASATPIQVTVSITTNNKTPILTQPSAISYVEVAGVTDSFANTSGTLSATDEDTSDTLVYSISSGVTGGAAVIGEITYDVSKTGTYGTLYVKSTTGNYSFAPNNTVINALAKDATQSETFAVTVNDGFGAISQNLVINFTGANDQPVLNSGGSVAGTYNAAAPTGIVGALVSSLVSASNVTDADTGAVYGLAITATDSNGTWFYSTNSGTDWAGVGEVSASSALLLAADANTRVYFQPNNSFVGAANLTIKAWDTTSGLVRTKVDTSTDSAFSSATNTVATNIVKPPFLDVNFDSSTTIATVAPEAVTYTPASYTTSVIIRAQNDTLNSSNTMSPYQRFGSSTVTKPFGTVGNFLVLGDATGQLTGGDDAGTFGFALPFALPANTASISISFDWVFNSYRAATSADQFKVGVTGTGFNIASPLTVTTSVLDQVTTTGNTKYTGTSATTYTLTTEQLGTADANGKYWLSFGLFEGTDSVDSAVGIDNIKITAIEGEVNNGATSPVTLTSFSAITGGNEDSEQTITFADLIATGDEASTAGEVNAFVIKAVSTGTLKIGASSATATAWVAGTNDVVDASHNVYWTPAADASGTLNAFTAIAKEIGGQTSLSSKLVTVSVTAINDAPILNTAKSPAFTGDYSGAAPSGAVGALVSSLVDFATPAGQVDNVTEVDTGAALGIAITVTDNTNGVWHYSTDAGSTWTAVGEVSATSALLLATDANTRVYFQASNGFVGLSNFTIKAWDQTSGTVGTKVDTSTSSAFSIATDNVEVKPAGNYAVYNDTTAVDTFEPSASSFVQGQLKKLTSTLTGFVNPTVNGDSTQEWTGDGTTTLYSYNGVNYVLSLNGKYGTLYTQKGVDVNSIAKVPYVYVVDNAKVNGLPANASDVDKFTVAGTHRPNGMTGTTYYDTLDIYVKGANDAPALTGEKAILLSNSITASELLQGYIDADNDDELSIADLTVNSGSLVNNNNGTWTFTPATGFSGEITLNYDVVDKLGAKVAATQTLSALPEAISLHSNLQSTLINVPFEYSSPKFSPDGNFTATLPNWLTIDAQTGVLTGMPTVADLGTFDIQISQNGVTDTLNLMVAPFKTGHLHMGETGNVGLDTVTYYNATNAVPAIIANTTENIVGSGFADNLTGNNKANILDGSAGADTLAGITGNDTYLVDNIGDVIFENANEGTDTVLSMVNYTLPANVEKLTLLGSANLSATSNELNNLIIGNAGNNTLAGGGGVDILKGGFGDDVYLVDSATVSIVESVKQGIDSVNATVSFVLPRNVENLTLLGSSNLNATGNTLNNVLQGNSGNNLLIGGSGKDVLIGGVGNDVLNGGTGIDKAIFDGVFSAYQFMRGTDSDGNAYVQVASQAETDVLYGIEFLQFVGENVARSLSSISIVGS